MKEKTLAFLTLLFGFTTNLFSDVDSMTGERLEDLIRELAGDEVVVGKNWIEFEFRNLQLVCIYDEPHNRMRIISPITRYTEVTENEKDKMMESNFHSALDARYAVSGGVLYAAYIHPLRSLDSDDVLSAVYQVYSLRISFGSEYSSGILTFGGDGAPDEEAI
ncbi:MAG: hypothetical protein AAGJ81_07685 [Verrucomicrobiota bacterium]